MLPRPRQTIGASELDRVPETLKSAIICQTENLSAGLQSVPCTIVVADSDGVVVVPRTKAAEVLEVAQEMDFEKNCTRILRSSNPLRKWSTAHRRQGKDGVAMKTNGNVFNRREVMKTSALALGSGLLMRPLAADAKTVNTNSSPSELKITDLRVATIVKPGPSPCPIIRLETNQGVYGLGEVRDGASATYALFLKSRIVGENPLQLDKIFRKIKQFGGPARQGGGVCAIEMALWDIAGKVYGAPVYAMVGGGKFRNKIRIYADTTESKDPKIYAQRMKERKEVMGLTWLKMDLGIDMVSDTPGTVTEPSDLTQWEANQLPHPFVATEVTDKGIAMLEQYVAAVRDAVGMEIPLSMDHLGHLGVKSIIRFGKAYEKYNLSWMEDVIPWMYTDLLKKISEREPDAHSHRRRYLSEGTVPGFMRKARGQQDSPRSRNLWRNPRNPQNRRHGSRSMEYRWPCTLLGPRCAAWRTCTVPPPPRISWR